MTPRDFTHTTPTGISFKLIESNTNCGEIEPSYESYQNKTSTTDKLWKMREFYANSTKAAVEIAFEKRKNTLQEIDLTIEEANNPLPKNLETKNNFDHPMFNSNSGYPELDKLIEAHKQRVKDVSKINFCS